MDFHPLADIFPLMEGAEFDELVASIKAHGLREPITLIDGVILDGRNRFRACEAAGVGPRFVNFTGADLYSFVADMNLHRRHMSPSQLGLAGARMETLKVGNPHRDKSLISTIVPITPSLEQVAAMLGVSKGPIKYGKIVLDEGTPEEIKAVEQGKAAVSTTAKAIRARNPRKKLAENSAKNHVGKNPERLHIQKLNAKMWGLLRDALTAITDLPRPSDVAASVRQFDKGHLIDARLIKSIQWLNEFERVWNAKRDAA